MSNMVQKQQSDTQEQKKTRNWKYISEGPRPGHCLGGHRESDFLQVLYAAIYKKQTNNQM